MDARSPATELTPLHEPAVIAASVGGTRVLESPGWLDYGSTPVFMRTLNVAAAKKPLLLRVAPDSVSVALTGDGALRKDGGFWVAELPGAAKTRLFISRADPYLSFGSCASARRTMSSTQCGSSAFSLLGSRSISPCITFDITSGNVASFRIGGTPVSISYSAAPIE